MLDLIGKAKAATSWNWPKLNIINPTTDPENQLKNILNNVLTWILLIAGAIAVIYLIYGGIMYITAGGDAEKATKGRTAIVNAIIGIVIIGLAFVIVSLVTNIIK